MCNRHTLVSRANVFIWIPRCRSKLIWEEKKSDWSFLPGRPTQPYAGPRADVTRYASPICARFVWLMLLEVKRGWTLGRLGVAKEISLCFVILLVCFCFFLFLHFVRVVLLLFSFHSHVSFLWIFFLHFVKGFITDGRLLCHGEWLEITTKGIR